MVQIRELLFLMQRETFGEMRGVALRYARGDELELRCYVLELHAYGTARPETSCIARRGCIGPAVRLCISPL